MFKKIKKHWYIFLIVLGIAIFTYYKISAKTVAQNKKETYAVKKNNLTETLSLSGKIAANEAVTIRFQTSGRLSWIGVKEGDYVKKYQMIAALDQRETEKNLKKYLNTYLDTRWDFDQTKEDYKDKAISTAMQRIIDQAQFALDNSVLDVEIKNLAIEFSNLFTPIEGIITRVDAPFAGVNITPATAEFEIVNPESIYFSVNADQNEVINLKEKDKGEVIFDSFPDKTYSGEVTSISFSPKTGETGTVYEVKLSIPKIEGLRLGMTGDVDFITKERKNVLNIPTSFINKDSNGDYVYVLIKEKKQKRYVKIGDEIDGQTIIKTGLSEGETIYD